MTAQELATKYGHSNSDSYTTLQTYVKEGIEYDLRVCMSGDDAYFEIINDLGDPVGDIFYEIPTGSFSELPLV